MHTAYSVHRLLKLPLTVESLVSFDDNLLVGTRQGHLLMYSVKDIDQGHEQTNNGTRGRGAISSSSSSSTSSSAAALSPRVQLLRTNKSFSDKPICQLCAVPEYSILISLSAGVVRVHDLDMAVMNFPVISIVDRARGASAFAVDLLKQRTLTGETGVAVRLAVAVKKRLQFFYWKNRRFHDLYSDAPLPDVPRALAWCRDSVCVGFRGEYSLIRVSPDPDTSELCELFPTGKDQEASVTLMADGERFALGKDEQTTFIDLEGNMKLYALQWSETPQALANDPPYLLAVLSKSVEVRTDEPRLNIQTVQLDRPRFISTPSIAISSSASGDGSGSGGQTHGGGLVYVASHSQIWCLKMVPVSVQVPQLIRDKQFELARALSMIGGDSNDSKAKRVQQIQTLNAFDLFCNFKFKEAMHIFYQLDVDTFHVVGLVGDLLPEYHRAKLVYPDRLPDLRGRELENAILALVEYLTKVRQKLKGFPESQKRTPSPLPIAEGQTIRDLRSLLEIVDTTLLKCYLRTNAPLVAPLLRLPDNKCHLEESVRALRRSNKFSELIILYNARGEHKKALKLLREHYNQEDSPLKSHLRTVEYLQNLGPDHWGVIEQFSPWVLDVSEVDGLTIFTAEDVPEVEELDRAKVLDFLLKTRPAVVIPYLRHVVGVWDDQNPVFHTALAIEYKDYVLRLMKEGGGGGGSGGTERALSATTEAREELRAFLKDEKSRYDAAMLEERFPLDALEEERATLLGRLGRHREAITLLLYRLRDVDATIEYCKRHDGHQQEEDGEEEEGVFSTAFRLLLRPPPHSLLHSLGLPINATPPADVSTALSLLSPPSSSRVSLSTALECLPDDIAVREVGDFLRARMEERLARRNHQKILRGLRHAEHLQVHEDRIALESRRLRVTELMVCVCCHQRFRPQGAVVRRADDGATMHLSCHQKSTREEVKAARKGNRKEDGEDSHPTTNDSRGGSQQL